MTGPWEQYQTGPWDKFKDTSVSQGDQDTPYSAVNWKTAGAPGVEQARTPGGDLEAGNQMLAGLAHGIAPAVGLVESKTPGIAPLSETLANAGNEPLSARERFMERSARTVGGVAPIAAAAEFAAPALTGIGASEGASFIPRLIGGLARGMAEDPIGSSLSQASGAALSGASAGTVAAIAPGHPNLEAAAELAPAAGAIITHLGAVPFGVIKANFGEEAAVSRLKEVMRQALGRDLGDSEMDSIARAYELKQTIPGFNPSLAESVWNSPMASDMLTTQRSMEASATGAERAGYRQRYYDNINSINAFGDAHAPGNPTTPQAVIDTISGKVTDLSAANKTAQEWANQDAATLGQKIPQGVSGDAGAMLREREQALMEDAKKNASRFADALGLNNNQTAYQLGPLQEKIADRFQQLRGEAAENQPLAYRDIMNDENPIATFDDLWRYRKRIYADYRKAVFDKNDQMAAKLAGMQKTIDDYILNNAPHDYTVTQGVGGYGGNFVDPAEESKLPEYWQRFREVYKNDVIDRFKQGVAYRVRQQNGEGYYITPDEKVGAAFWKTPSGVKQFNTTFQDDKDAVSALGNVVLDDLGRSALKNGEINPSLYEPCLAKIKQSGQYQALPDSIQGQIDNITDATRGLAVRRSILDVRAKEVGDQGLAKRLEKIAGGDDPSSLAIGAIKNPLFMQKIMNTIGADQSAQQAWKRLIWNTATGSQEQLEAALASPGVRAALGQQHVGYLKDIFDAANMAGAAGKMAGKDITPDLYSGWRTQMGQGVDAIVAKLWAVETGRTSIPWVLTNIGGRAFRTQRMNALGRVLKQAFYDPQVAKNFAESLRDRGTFSPSKMKMRSYLFNAGYDFGKDDEPDNSAPAPAPVTPPDGESMFANGR